VSSFFEAWRPRLLDGVLRLFRPPAAAPVVQIEARAAAAAVATEHELRLTDECLQAIEEDEGCRLTAYPDAGYGWEKPTIGFGHTGPDVHQGLTITQAQAEELLKADLEAFETGVDDLLSDDAWAVTTDNEFSAMVSLAFNIGLPHFKASSVLRFHNAGQTQQAADAFLLWDKSNGRVLPGLVRRRHEERAMYLGGKA